MPTFVTTDPGQTLTTFPTQTVEISTDVTSGAWTLVPYLWCSKFKIAANAYDVANLRFEIGAGVLQPGARVFDDWQPLDIRGKFVRVTVELDEPITWVGYVLTQNLQRDGIKSHSGENKFEGESQVFDAVGLEWFLDRRQVDSSIVYNSTAADDRIMRALKFNGGESQTIDMKAAHRGNRSAVTGDEGLYVFSSDTTTDNKWTATQIVQYLLKFHTPIDSGDNAAPCEFSLHVDDTACLDAWTPTVACERKTVYQLLNEIISPNRGLVWWAEYNTTGVPSVFIRVATMALSDLVLPGEGTFVANRNQITLNFDGELDVRRVGLKDLGYRNYHRVIARGARQTCTFTLGFDDGTLEADWKTETETAYQAGAVADGDYSGLTTLRQRQRNDAMRLTDLFARVYSYFKIKSSWDGKSGDGGSATHHYAFAELSPTGSVLGSQPFSVAGIRLLNRTRLKLGVDYTTPSAPVSNAPAGSLEEFLKPFAFIKVEHEPAIDSNPDPNRWQYTEKLHEAKFGGGTKISNFIKTSYHLVMQEHSPGFKLVAAGAPQHTIALNFFDDTAGAEPSATKPELDYTDLRITLCAESDNYAEGLYETPTLPSPPVPIEELIIDLGDDYRLVFLAESTVVHLNKGIPVKASAAAVLRDDRAFLADIAGIAYQWYREDRQSLTVEFRQHKLLFGLGQLVTTIGDGTTQTTVNTVVSSITYDFSKNGGMTIETNDKTLDIKTLGGLA